MTSIPNCFYRVSIKAIIRRGEGLLLVKEGTWGWSLPGGGLDHGEPIEEGLKRELVEELSFSDKLTIADQPAYIGLSVGKRNDFDGEIRDIPLCFICYDVEIQGDVRSGGEASEAKFVDISEIKRSSQSLAYDERATILEVASL